MNIENSGLNALFSATDSLKKVQQRSQSERGVSQEFSDTLKDKIRQMKGMNEVADEKGAKEESTELVGTKLPLKNQLEENIDLEDTLEALENVMNMLESVGTEEVNLEEKLAALAEKLETLAAGIPQSSEWEENLALVADKLEKMRSLISSEEGLGNDIASLEQQAEIVESQIQRIMHELDSQARLATEKNAQLKTVTSIKGQESENFSAQTLAEVKVEIKKESLSLKQIAEERSLGLTAKTASDSMLVQENAIIAAKQNQNASMLDEVLFELNSDKPITKFATDIAQLNQSLPAENKAGISPMSKHFAHPEWNKEMGERILWMHKQAVPSAELRLNPRHLGPVTIKLNVTQDQVNVSFTAQHATVKEAIEAAIPKLREMFSAQQLNLADVNVTQDDKQQRQSNAFAQMGSGQEKGGYQDPEKMTNTDNESGVLELADEIEVGRAIASNGILSIFA